jgi:hypothetical protein
MVLRMVLLHGCMCSPTDPVNGAEVVVQSGSVEFYEGKPLSLRCNIAKGTHVSYQWLVDGKPLPLSPLHNQTQEQLFIYRYCIVDGLLFLVCLVCLSCVCLSEVHLCPPEDAS